MPTKQERAVATADARLMDSRERSRLLALHDREERRLLRFLEIAAAKEARYDAAQRGLIDDLVTTRDPVMVAAIAAALDAAHEQECYWDGVQQAIHRELVRINQVEDQQHRDDADDKAAIAAAFGLVNGADADQREPARTHARPSRSSEGKRHGQYSTIRRAG